MPPLVDLSKACEQPFLDLTCAGNQTSFSVDYSKYAFFGKKTKPKLKERFLSPARNASGHFFSVFLFCFAMGPMYHYFNRITRVLIRVQ